VTYRPIKVRKSRERYFTHPVAPNEKGPRWRPRALIFLLIGLGSLRLARSPLNVQTPQHKESARPRNMTNSKITDHISEECALVIPAAQQSSIAWITPRVLLPPGAELR
jgi:hypothetical protein